MVFYDFMTEILTKRELTTSLVLNNWALVSSQYFHKFGQFKVYGCLSHHSCRLYGVGRQTEVLCLQVYSFTQFEIISFFLS